MVMHIIVLLFEVLYYSMFMKFARKEGKFWRYLLLFSLITIVLIFTGTGNLYVYLIFVLLKKCFFHVILKKEKNNSNSQLLFLISSQQSTNFSKL